MRRFMAMTLGLVLVLGACGDDDDAASDGASDEDPPASDEPGTDTGDGAGPLDGRTFVSTDVTENGQPRPLVEGTEIAFDFAADGQIGVNAGCNSMSGTAEITADSITAPSLATTDMGCDPPRHDQDDWLAGLLTTGLGYTLEGDRLTLTVDGTVISLVDRKTLDPDRPLEETVWQLDGLVEGDGVSSVPAGASATMVISGGEVVVENQDCNTGRGPVAVGEGDMTVGPLMMTRMGCPPGPADVEAMVTKVLDGTVTYRIESDRLDISNPNGAGLTFTAAE